MMESIVVMIIPSINLCVENVQERMKLIVWNKTLQSNSHIRVIIIDDERSGRLVLQTLIQEYCNNVEVVAVEESAEQGRKAITSLNPDVVFLDIEMPFQNGFEMLESMDSREFDVVFVTAYESYSTSIASYSPLGFLLKPFNLSQLRSMLEKYKMQKIQ